MRPDDFRRALADIKAGTDKPYGVNIPLNNPRAPELLDIAYEARIPAMVASQGGPREHLARFRAIGTKWLHVVASVEHAKKAEAAAWMRCGTAWRQAASAGRWTLVLVRRGKAVKLPSWRMAVWAARSPRPRAGALQCSWARASSPRPNDRAATTAVLARTVTHAGGARQAPHPPA
jgi:hypothetical protein